MRRRPARGQPGPARRKLARPVRRLALVLLLAALAALVFAAAASADAVSPEAGPTSNAVKTDTVYKVTLIMGLAVLALVWVILFYSLARFRSRRGRLVPQVRGNTPLEVGWTFGAIALALAVAVVTFVFLTDIKNPAPTGVPQLAEARNQEASLGQPAPPGGKALEIKVQGQQFFWRYQYPNGAVSFHDLVVPKDATVILKITSNDVAHSWWIPALGGKMDAIPDLTNESWFKATKTGVFKGRCAELCGVNHAAMTAKVVVKEPDDYENWVERQKQLIQEAQKAGQRQKRLLQKRPQAGATKLTRGGG